MGQSYQYFMPGRLGELSEDVEFRMTISSLAEGRHKYEAKIVDARISSESGKYPDTLWLRFPKGQLHDQPWSLEVIREVDLIPPKFK